jgi:hypothetical protein
MRFIDESFSELFGSCRYIAAFYLCASLILVALARLMLARGFDERTVLWVGAASVLPLHFLAYGLMRLCRKCLRLLIRCFTRCLVWVFCPQGGEIPAQARGRMAYAASRAGGVVLVFLIGSFSSAAANLILVNAPRVSGCRDKWAYVNGVAIITEAACLALPFLSLLFALDRAGRAPKVVRDYEEKALAYSRIALQEFAPAPPRTGTANESPLPAEAEAPTPVGAGSTR